MNSPSTTPANKRSFSLWWWLGTAALLAAAITISFIVVGDKPQQKHTKLLSDPPPLILRDNEVAHSTIDRANTALESRKFGVAQRLFEDELASSPGSSVAQVGALFSQWKKLGSQSVLRRLTSAQRAQPEDPYLMLSLGELELFMGSGEEAALMLKKSRALAREAAASFDVARRADDLLHPRLAPGYPPIFIAPDSVNVPSQKLAVAEILKLVESDDRIRAGMRARDFIRTKEIAANPRVLSAMYVATFDKDNPRAAEDALQMLNGEYAKNSTVQLHLAFVQLWMSDKKSGLRNIRAITTSATAFSFDRAQAKAVLRAMKFSDVAATQSN